MPSPLLLAFGLLVPLDAANSSMVAELQKDATSIWHQILNDPTEPLEPVKIYYPTYVWTMPAIIAVTLLVVTPLAYGAAILGLNVWHYSNHQAGYRPVALDYTGATVPDALRYEMSLMLLCPLLALLAAPWTSCSEGPPWWLYAAYGVVLLRSKYVEYQVMGTVKQSWTCMVWADFLIFGMLDHADFFTDAAFPVHAWSCEAGPSGRSVTEDFVANAGFMAPAVQRGHVWFIALLLFLTAFSTQHLLGQLVASLASLRQLGDAVLADACAMTGLATLLDSKIVGEGNRGGRMILLSVSKVILENVFQFIFQTIFLAVMFDYLKPAGRGKLILSILLSLLGALKTSLGSLRLAVAELASCRGDGALLMVLLVNLVAVFFIVWTALKLYFVFHCESHLWSFTGCVPN